MAHKYATQIYTYICIYHIYTYRIDIPINSYEIVGVYYYYCNGVVVKSET